MLDFVMFDIDLALNTGRNLEHWGNINKKGHFSQKRALKISTPSI